MALLFYSPRPHPFTTVLVVGRDFEMKRGPWGQASRKTEFDSTWKLILLYIVSIYLWSRTCDWSFWGWPLVLNDCKRPARRGMHKRATKFFFSSCGVRTALIRYSVTVCTVYISYHTRSRGLQRLANGKSACSLLTI